MGLKQIDAVGAKRLLRESGKLFLQGMSGEPRALNPILGEDPAAVSHLSILTSFVSGINRFDCTILEGAGDVAGFFPAPSKGFESYRQIVSTYFGVTETVRSFAADTVFIPVSMPGANGMVTPGLSAEFVEPALDMASQRVAIICPSMPVLAHNACLPLERFTHSMIDRTPPLQFPAASATPDPVADAITDHLVRLIGDNATLQIGIGRIPGRLFMKLSGHRNLKIHSGLVSEEIRLLVEAGAIDTEVPISCATLLGSAAFYRWLDGRQDFRLHPIDYTHHPSTLAAITGLVTVNSAIEVDLLGQVNAERAGRRLVSAAGGLPDFSAGGHRSPGGCSIIALPAADTSGNHSRIVARLGDRAPVTVPRGDVDFVVTEYGIAELSGKTSEERAQALIDIAAPEARPILTRAL